jgi:hypothetical protein
MRRAGGSFALYTTNNDVETAVRLTAGLYELLTKNLLKKQKESLVYRNLA